MRRHGQVDLRQMIRDGELTVDAGALHRQLADAVGAPVSDFGHVREGGPEGPARAA